MGVIGLAGVSGQRDSCAAPDGRGAHLQVQPPAAELVRAHGGEIRLVEGTIGATFRVTIPDRAVDLKARRGERARA